MPSTPLHALYRSLSPLLRPLGLPYAFVMRQRRRLYAKGGLYAHKPACPCVSVGNIAWGGTGKTPLVGWLLDWARQQRLKAVVLTRGYKGETGSRPLLVRPDTPAEQAGDEPLMLAQAFPESGVLAHPFRAGSALYAENYLEPDLFVLDDGMQHLGVRRDLDIVLLRPEDLDEEWNRVIPSGSWREGASALRAAAAFAIKMDPEEFVLLEPLAEKRLAAFGKPFFSFSLAPAGLRPLAGRRDRDSGEPVKDTRPPLISSEDYRDLPYILISGVGNPAGVERTAERLIGRPPLQHFDFEDHHAYSAQDIQAVLKLSAAPLAVVCTAKDAVKLRPLAEAFGSVPVWVLETAVEFGPALFAGSAFPVWWETQWRAMVEQQRTRTGKAHGNEA